MDNIFILMVMMSLIVYVLYHTENRLGTMCDQVENFNTAFAVIYPLMPSLLSL